MSDPKMSHPNFFGRNPKNLLDFYFWKIINHNFVQQSSKGVLVKQAWTQLSIEKRSIEGVLHLPQKLMVISLHITLTLNYHLQA
jgi:hypothetical protein